MKKALISLSGGLDSTVLLSNLLSNGYEVEAVTFFYGSKHNPYENEAAEKIAALYNIPLQKMDIY